MKAINNRVLNNQITAKESNFNEEEAIFQSVQINDLSRHRLMQSPNTSDHGFKISNQTAELGIDSALLKAINLKY